MLAGRPHRGICGAEKRKDVKRKDWIQDDAGIESVDGQKMMAITVHTVRRIVRKAKSRGRVWDELHRTWMLTGWVGDLERDIISTLDKKGK